MRSLSVVSSLAVLALAGAVASGSGQSMASSTNNDSVAICHHAGPNRFITISVGENAVAYHVDSHGDSVGACTDETPGE